MQNQTPFPIAPTAVRYIKLGAGGAFAKEALAAGKLVLDFHEIDHGIAASGDAEALYSACLAFRNSKAQTAREDAREITAFYHASETDLWITLEAGKLWWGFAKAEVIPTDPADGLGARYRRIVGGWSSHDAQGIPLEIRDLDGRIASLAGYRRTICNVKEAERVVRLINATPHPEVIVAEETREQLLASVRTLIPMLSADDFEILIDLIVARSGWERVGAIGGIQKTVDLEVVQPLTGERAFVQVKSRTRQAEFDAYLDQFEAYGIDRMIYAYHTGPALKCTDPRVQIMDLGVIANSVLERGLLRWLTNRVR